MRRLLGWAAALAGVAALASRMRPDQHVDEQPPWEPEPLARLATWQPSEARTAAAALGRALWAAPMTAVGLLGALTTGGRMRRTPDGLLLVTGARGPLAAQLRRRGFSATTLGQVVIAVSEPSEALLAHERVHARQAERLGPLFGPAYLALLAAYGYRRHPFERAARIAGRRAAGPHGSDGQSQPTR